MPVITPPKEVMYTSAKSTTAAAFIPTMVIVERLALARTSCHVVVSAFRYWKPRSAAREIQRL